jgi:hypothetical protein
VVFPHALGIQGDTRQRLLAYGALSFNAIGPRTRLLEESIAAAEGALDWIAAQCRRPWSAGPAFVLPLCPAAVGK